MRDNPTLVLDIYEALERIEKYAVYGQNRFESDELIQNSMIRHLQILGEAAYKVSNDFKAEHPDSPWRRMSSTRHVLVHDYFDINLKIVWDVMERELPPLKLKIKAILDLYKNNQKDIQP